MNLTLIRKEVREHGLVFGAAACLMFLTQGFVLLLTILNRESAGPFATHQVFVWYFAPILCAVVCNRLIVKEYTGRTQLFLESLPLTRLQMLLVKYGSGLCYLGTVFSMCFVLCILFGLRSEQITIRFLLIMFTRSMVYVFFWYCFFCLMGMTGRYRFAFYIMQFMVWIAIDSLTDFELLKFGPLAVMDGQYPYERLAFPWHNINVTLLISLAFTVLTIALATMREGSVANMMAEKMTHREKVMMAVFLLGFGAVIGIYDEKTEKELYDMDVPIELVDENVFLKISPGVDGDIDEIEAFAQRVRDHLAGVREYLSIEQLPRVFIVHLRDLDANRYERAIIRNADGLLIRANMMSEGWDEDRFIAWLVHQLILTHSDYRAAMERRMWVLDGFGHFWVGRSNPVYMRKLRLRAAYAVGDDVDEGVLRDWHFTGERLGRDISQGLAWAALQTLNANFGEEKLQAFLRRSLNTSVPRDARAVWHEWNNPVTRALQEETGWDIPKLAGSLQTSAKQWQTELADELSKIPRLSGEVEFEVMSETTRSIRYRLKKDVQSEGLRYRFRYGVLEMFEEALTEYELENASHGVTEDWQNLPTSYETGTRFYYAFVVEDDSLGCEIVSGWFQKEVN